MRDRSDLRWNGLALHLGRRAQSLLTVVPDARWPGMYRIRLRDGRLSDMVNLARAKDAAADVALSELNNSKGSRNAPGRPPVRVPGRELPDTGAARRRVHVGGAS
jgi:hypothetical protein